MNMISEARGGLLHLRAPPVYRLRTTELFVKMRTAQEGIHELYLALEPEGWDGGGFLGLLPPVLFLTMLLFSLLLWSHSGDQVGLRDALCCGVLACANLCSRHRILHVYFMVFIH